MSDMLKVIERVIQEHRIIRANLKHTGESVTDIEALFMLNKESARWSQSSVKELEDKQGQLLKGISALEKGLKHHFTFEEEALPPLLGDVLMKTILHEHVEITGLIDKAEASLQDAALGGLNQQELLAKKTGIEANIYNITELVEGHSKHEEIILDMIKKALEA